MFFKVTITDCPVPPMYLSVLRYQAISQFPNDVLYVLAAIGIYRDNSGTTSSSRSGSASSESSDLSLHSAITILSMARFQEECTVKTI